MIEDSKKCSYGGPVIRSGRFNPCKKFFQDLRIRTLKLGALNIELLKSNYKSMWFKGYDNKWCVK